METERTTTERQTGRTYKAEFLPAVIGYTLVLGGIVVLVDFDTAADWKYLIALLPLLPALLGAAAIARHMRRLDEFQRSVQLDGMAAGFGIAMVAAMTLGFLGMAGLETARVGPWVIYSAGMLTWLVVSGAALRDTQ
jgi:hypothetical protein